MILTQPPILPIHATALRRRCRGMNFPEVLFAVMILGIGFIMVAAIFPVAIQQSKSSTEETMSVRIVEAALAAIDANATAAYLPVTATAPGQTIDTTPLLAIRPSDPLPPANPADPLWKRLQGDFISSIDPRFAFAALYRRGAPGGQAQDFAQVFIIPMQVQNRGKYVAEDVWNGVNLSPLAPIGVTVAALNTSFTPHRLTFNAAIDAPVEGAVVILADDPDNGRRNGRVLRLGRQLGPALWELQPGWDLQAGEDSTDPIGAYLVGRGIEDPATGTVYTGPNQAISVFTTTIPIRPN